VCRAPSCCAKARRSPRDQMLPTSDYARHIAPRPYRLFNDPGLGMRLGEGGRQLWAEPCSIRHHVESLLKAYGTLLAV
jgi:hypothetical protein